ncbi:MAG: lysophospholipid acyltransferase family protein [Chromatiales bacterium]|jgi:KDO2-lipid IV(A) lauroyltransferase|nr:lysophospholipid acyltransferase family protein [Chromatiales bacterium]
MREALLKVFLRFCAVLPLPAAHVLGAGIGTILGMLPGRTRRVTMRNLELCFPELSQTERKRLARSSLREAGKTAAETGAVWGRDVNQVLALVRAAPGRELVDTALTAGKGAIIITPHLGNWEMVGLYCASRWPLTSLYRPPRMQGLEEFVRHARERGGAKLVPTNVAGVRYMFHALERSECVGLLPDQDPTQGAGVFAPFFGIPAYTMVLLARLSQRTGAPVFFAYAERLCGGAGFEVHFIAAPTDLGEADLETICTIMNAGIETCIRRIPAQYQWSYKRFRTRPVGEPSLY